MGLLLLGGLLGGALAISTLRVCLLVDYDSGAQLQVIKVGPFEVREEPLRNSWFASVPMRNGRLSLAGKPDWHTAAIFWRSSKVSPNMEGGSVLKYVGRLELLFRETDSDKAARTKEDFLRALAEGGPDKAGDFMKMAEAEILPSPRR